MHTPERLILHPLAVCTYMHVMYACMRWKMMVGFQGTDLLHVPTAPPLLSEQTEVRTRRVTMLAMQRARV